MALDHEISQVLKAKSGQWVSGQELAAMLKVSRTSVWKHIKKLRSRGYEIQSSPHKGYRLTGTPDRLSAEEVCPGLASNSFGQDHYYYFDEIASTNDYAKKLAAQGYPEGTVVVADMQLSGKGRRGRNWFSPSGHGLYFSLILRPQLPLKEIPRIPLVMAAAVANTLRSQYDLQAQIKWPNDMWVENRKVAGILTEAASDLDGVEYIVAGIGINVNNRISDFPDDLRTPPTSLQAEVKAWVSRVQLLQKLLYDLKLYYSELLDGKFAMILEQVRSISLVIGQSVRFETNTGFLEGKALAMDEDGFLQVEDARGKIHIIMSGEIMMVPKEDQEYLHTNQSQ